MSHSPQESFNEEKLLSRPNHDPLIEMGGLYLYWPMVSVPVGAIPAIPVWWQEEL